MVPSSPLMLICPMRLPVLLPTASRIISSSDHKVPSKKTRAQLLGYRRAAWYEEEGFPGRGLDDFEPDSIALFAQSRILPGRFQVERQLAGYGERDYGEAGGARRSCQLHPLVQRQLDTPHEIRRQHVEDRVCGDDREDPRGSVDVEAVPLAQMQQAGDSVDIAAGQHHPGDR